MFTVIFSIDGDASTSDVMDWISSSGVEAVRVNGISSGNSARHLSNESDHIFINDRRLNKDEIISGWIRKREGAWAVELPANENKWLSHYVNEHVKAEFDEAWQSFMNYFNGISTLGTIKGDINKLYSLETAAKCGLIIPATIVTNTKRSLLEFSGRYTGIICKAIGNADFFPIEEIYWGMYTAKLTRGMIGELPDRFFPCLAQEYIEKEYEIRTFYLDGSCYSMAILSQADEQTAVDFRRYNNEKPNRTVPCKLPKEQEEKIDVFMRAAGLNTGSLDLIRSKDGRYVFLEVNPAGQFGMVSYPCNYYLEKKIADWLIDQKEKNGNKR